MHKETMIIFAGFKIPNSIKNNSQKYFVSPGI